MDDPWASGLFGSIGPAGGGNAGGGVGCGLALREVEGLALTFDLNAGDWSGTLTWGEQGFNGLAISVGPGLGASSSAVETSTISPRSIGACAQDFARQIIFAPNQLGRY